MKVETLKETIRENYSLVELCKSIKKQIESFDVKLKISDKVSIDLTDAEICIDVTDEEFFTNYDFEKPNPPRFIIYTKHEEGHFGFNGYWCKDEEKNKIFYYGTYKDTIEDINRIFDKNNEMLQLLIFS